MNSITEIAEIAHETNKAYCETLGDHSQLHWCYAPQWQRDSAMDGVRSINRKVVTRPDQSHENWLKHKEQEGWKFGTKKDPELKTHPCMVPFSELTEEQQIKDYLFFAVVTTLLGRSC